MKSVYRVIGLILCILLWCTACSGYLELGSGEILRVAQDGEMQVHFLDVGQGDSILIECDGEYMLIDAGENNKGQLVTDYIKNRGITKLNYVIGTHPHSDHIGGLDTVIESMNIDKVIMPNKSTNTKTFEDVLIAVKNKGLKVTAAIAGDTYKIGGGEFTIISPDKDYGDELNNWSVVLKLTYGNTNFILTGDAEKEAEQSLCNADIDLKADVLKLGHHGSSTSGSEEFLEAVTPTYGVISCGKDNSYGHPHRETMDKINKYDITVYRTDMQGTVTAVSDGDNITWITEGEMEVSAINDNGENEVTYVLNVNTKRFHTTICKAVKDMNESNRENYTGERDALIEQGYLPCGNCKP